LLFSSFLSERFLALLSSYEKGVFFSLSFVSPGPPPPLLSQGTRLSLFLLFCERRRGLPGPPPPPLHHFPPRRRDERLAFFFSDGALFLPKSEAALPPRLFDNSAEKEPSPPFFV